VCLFRANGDDGLAGELHGSFGMAVVEGMNVEESIEVITAQNGKQVTKIVTTSGVVGFIAADVPLAAIEGLYKKLLLTQEKLNKTQQSPASANPTRHPFA